MLGRQHTMKIEDVTNFGKGLIELSSDPIFIKIRKQMMTPVLKMLFRELGVFKMIKMEWRANQEKKSINKYDWSRIEKRGPKKEDLDFVIEDVANMKVLARMLGNDQACLLFSKILNQTDEILAAQKPARNVLAMPVDEFKSLDDPFTGFKEFIKASENEMVKEGTHAIEIIEDTNESLVYHVSYCIAHEVAGLFGDPIFGIPWCQIDDIALPKVGSEIGFKYSRSGTLCLGSPKCDFRFERVAPTPLN